jgi:type VI secretion system secreted protein Hcp
MPSDYLLEVQGIKGESQDSKHKECIEIDSFSWGVANAGSFQRDKGGGTGKSSFQDVHFSTKVNAASPNLATACATGQHITKATLYVRKATGQSGQGEYYTIALENVVVSSYQSGGHNGGDSMPMDQFSLNFAKINFDYRPQGKSGSLEAPINFKYNIPEAKS